MINDQEFEVGVEDIQRDSKQGASSPAEDQVTLSEIGQVLAPMAGVITQIHVKRGDVVKANQGVVTLEAMKMENKISAGKDGSVSDIKVSAGQNVSAGDLMFVVV
ncbi:MAG TPA: biotin/lipoyl-containing protein [Desulfosporosinus sp.]|nr:biotin/lipoyl-containing protein [Desulfosporosinus sp.]